MRVKGLRQTKVSQYVASGSCFQRLRGRRTARCSLGAGICGEYEAREEQEDDEPASVRDGSEADEAGERWMEEDDERDSLERKAAVSEPIAAWGVVGDGICVAGDGEENKGRGGRGEERRGGNERRRELNS